MSNSWLSLVPPLLVLLFTFITKNLNRSLIIGIISAALITHDGAPIAAFTTLYKHFTAQLTDIDKLYLYGFLICISTLITLFNYTGSAIAFARTITHRFNTKRMVEASCVGLSCTFFLDDYLSILTTGYIMRPMTDRLVIPRAKLAFLIHSFSGPLVILVPISSWVAMITTQLDLTGISPEHTNSTKIIGEPFLIYLQSIPFIFYSFILASGIFFIIYRRISYGPMQVHEEIAQKTGNLYGGKEAPRETTSTQKIDHASSLDLVIPIVTLTLSVIIGILYTGGYYLFGGPHSFIDAIKHNTQTNLVLCAAGVIALMISFILTFIRRTFSLEQLPAIVKEGINLMSPALIMVVLASTLGVFLKDDLQTGTYLATTVLKSIPLLLLPCMLFFVSTGMAIITGSSWGTIAILTPISVQMLLSLTADTLPVEPSAIPLLFSVLGAIFSGAVCGDHISPLSETTIMSATSAGSYPLDHAYTQFPYALPAIISTGLAFLCAGILTPWGRVITLIGSLTTGLLSCLLLIIIFNYLYAKKRAHHTF